MPEIRLGTEAAVRMAASQRRSQGAARLGPQRCGFAYMSEVLHHPGQRDLGRRVFREAANGRDRVFGIEREAGGGVRHSRECADGGDKGWPRET
jgi:hypothetical protein